MFVASYNLHSFRSSPLLRSLQLTPLFDPDPNPGAGNTTNTSNTDPFASITSVEQLPDRIKGLINNVVTTRLNEDRERRGRDGGGDGMSKAERDELQRLRDEAKARELKDLEAKGNYEAAIQSIKKDSESALTAEREKGNKVLAKLREKTIRAEVIAAASLHNAFNPQQVAKLLDDRIRLTDDFEIQCLDEHGKPAFKNGTPLTVTDLVAQYLDESPNLRKPSNTTGSGSTGGASTSADNPTTKGGDGVANEKVADAKKAWEDAAKRAQETRSASDITKAHQLKRAYEKLLKDNERSRS
jgi:hypothetical protein